LQLLVTEASGREVIKQTHQITVPGEYKPPRELFGLKKDPVVTTTPQGATVHQYDNTPAALNAAVIGSVIDLLKSMKEVQKSPQLDLVAILKPIADAQAQTFQLLLALITKDKDKSVSSPQKEFLDMMQAVKSLIPTPPNPGNPAELMGNIVETIKQLRGVTEELSPDKEEKGDPMRILGQLAEVVMTEQQQRKNQTGTGGPVTRPQLVREPVPGAAAEPVPLPTLTRWQQVLQQQGPRLLLMARMGRDAGVMADFSLEVLPPELRDDVVEFFSHDPETILSDIISVVPEFATHRLWLKEWVDAVIDGLFGEEPKTDGQYTKTAD
jgi:hypothetical protein